MTVELAIKISEIAECVKIIMYCQVAGIICFVVGAIINLFVPRN